MPLPSTGYATATISNPSSALTDFTLLIDLSTMPSEWWAVVDTSDGTKGRAAKNDETELPSDWIDFDNSGETGFLRVIWSGTLSDSGTQILRIYPPVAANDSYAVTDTYGGRNAYPSSCVMHLTFEEDPSGSAPQAINRVSAVNNGTSGGTMLTEDLVAAQVGNGWQLNTDDLINCGSDTSLDDLASLAYMYWIKQDAADDRGNHWAKGDNDEMNTNSLSGFGEENLRFSYQYSTTTALAVTDDIATELGDWVHCVGKLDDADKVPHIFINGAEASYFTQTTGDGTKTTRAINNLLIGVNGFGFGNFINGIIDDFWVFNVSIDDAWISQEFAQSDDNTTFWGTWAWNAGSGDTFTATAALTLGGVQCSASASFAPGTKTADAAMTLGGVQASAAATHTAPTFTGSAAPVLGGVQCTAAATSSEPTFTGSTALVLGGIQAAGTATHVAPIFAGSTALVLGGVQATAAGTFAIDAFVASAALTLGGAQASGTATFAPGTKIATAVITTGGVIATGTATHVAPTFTATASLTLGAVVVSATASFSEVSLRPYLLRTLQSLTGIPLDAAAGSGHPQQVRRMQSLAGITHR